MPLSSELELEHADAAGAWPVALPPPPPQQKQPELIVPQPIRAAALVERADAASNPGRSEPTVPHTPPPTPPPTPTATAATTPATATAPRNMVEKPDTLHLSGPQLTGAPPLAAAAAAVSRGPIALNVTVIPTSM